LLQSQKDVRKRYNCDKKSYYGNLNSVNKNKLQAWLSSKVISFSCLQAKKKFLLQKNPIFSSKKLISEILPNFLLSRCCCTFNSRKYTTEYFYWTSKLCKSNLLFTSSYTRFTNCFGNIFLCICVWKWFKTTMSNLKLNA
jgi:hypothetical protein